MWWSLVAVGALASDPATPSAMVGHFEAATHTMLAVGTGETKEARRQAKALADRPGVPEVLEAAADAVADCRKVDCAGPAVAQMARTCAACHESIGRGPRVGPMEALPGRNQRERHTFAALFLWIGLVTPHEQAFTVGIEGAIPPVDLDSSDELRVLEARFQQLVTAAASEADWDGRAEQFGQMLTLCVECHEAAGLVK
jgi:hypothetical protein